ncbi:hypothetical protein HDV05_000294, partial [Chytridiales sp. JEL 0842]
MVSCPFPMPADTKPFLKTRARLFNLLHEAVGKENAAIVLPTAVRPIRDESDAEFPAWKQTANVMYLLGRYQISGGAVVLTATKNAKQGSSKPLYDIHLYLPDQTQREMIFSGAFPSESELIAEHRVSSVRNIKNFAQDFAGQKLITTVTPKDLFASIGPNAGEELQKAGIRVQQDLRVKEAFVEARFVKIPEELQLL